MFVLVGELHPPPPPFVVMPLGRYGRNTYSIGYTVCASPKLILSGRKVHVGITKLYRIEMASR